MIFYTAINCMDGRVQLPVIEFIQAKFNVDYVDMITEPGPNRILAENAPAHLVESILERVRISVEKHGSTGIVIVGHPDCAGNPTSDKEQDKQTAAAVELLRRHFPNVPVMGVWLDGNRQAKEL